ncbi:MAG TPA: hypothetical protein DER20_10290, partial [Lachnospiraceae bacterium]|nr:hypothetical protein [Lachnospiraceae bacterium]
MRADRQREKWHVPDCVWKCHRLYHTDSLSAGLRGCSDDSSACCTGGSGETAGGTGPSSGGTGSAAGGTGAAGSNAAGSSTAGSTGTGPGDLHSGGQRQRHLRRGLPHGTDGECSRWNGSMARYGLCGML